MDIGSISTGLRLAEDGIWYGSESHPLSYPSEGNDVFFSIEDNSFWFQHRNRCIVSAVRSFPPADGGTLFDIGGGNGFVSQGLAAAGFEVALLEPGHVGASNAKRRGVRTVVCATTDKAGFKPGSLPAVGLFDVIEHIPDDAEFLSAMHDLLQPAGLLYATVPAFGFLWSEEDVQAGHIKRYTLSGICGTLRAAGFEILFSSYIFRFLPLPILLLRTLPYKLGLRRAPPTPATSRRDHAAPKGLAARVLNGLLESELDNLAAGRPMHFGGSCLVVARAKPFNREAPGRR